MSDIVQDTRLIGLAADIISAYVSNNSVPLSELPNLIGSVHASLTKIGGKPEEPLKQVAAPPVPIRKSITDEYLICLEDGKRFKSLKRHLQTVYGLTPDGYREKWGLSREYPMVAPAYAKARSALAKEMGLGASRRRIAPDMTPIEAVPDVEPEVAPQEEPVLESVDKIETSMPDPVPVKKPATRRKKSAAAEA